MAAPIAAATALGFALEDWPGSPPVPRSLDDLCADPHFLQEAAAVALAGMAEARKGKAPCYMTLTNMRAIAPLS